MDYKYSEIAHATQQWAQQAVASQYLEAEAVQGILDIDSRTPQSLLMSSNARPLIVAFMGGTGVGKSSLLNRLAGSAIARTGIERPTSREVTLYHHHSVNIQILPDELPLQKIKIAAHQEEVNRNIIWIDMPDFDSTEASNKDLVLQWLPHIDVLIYVVSPERYRDNKAWRLLLAEGAKHGWIFVLNQWDKGQNEQYLDFQQQLAQAKFDNPLIFRTDCTESSADEFESLVSTLGSIANQHSIEQLEQRGLHVRKQHLQHQLQQCLPLLEIDQAFAQLSQDWKQQWQQSETTLNEAFHWTLQQHAHSYAQKGSQLLSRKNPVNLWDDWAQSFYENLIDGLIQSADQLHIPVRPLRHNLHLLRKQAKTTVNQQTELSCRLALINPGNKLQRIILKISRFCEIVLPLITMGIVAYQVFQGFYASALDGKEYLGVNFASHSVLLILISWLLPYFIHKKMQPSIEKAALRGLKKGLQQALISIDSEIQNSIQQQQKQQQALLNELQKYIQQCEQTSPLEKIEADSPLTRMLIE